MATGYESYEMKYRNALLGMNGIASEISTATASGGAATCNDYIGKITTESLTTAQNAIYTLTLTNNKIKAGDIVLVSVGNGDNSQGTPMLGIVTPGSGQAIIKVINKHASSEALNGTLVISFVVIKAL